MTHLRFPTGFSSVDCPRSDQRHAYLGRSPGRRSLSFQGSPLPHGIHWSAYLGRSCQKRWQERQGDLASSHVLTLPAVIRICFWGSNTLKKPHQVPVIRPALVPLSWTARKGNNSSGEVSDGQATTVHQGI